MDLQRGCADIPQWPRRASLHIPAARSAPQFPPALPPVTPDALFSPDENPFPRPDEFSPRLARTTLRRASPDRPASELRSVLARRHKMSVRVLLPPAASPVERDRY